MKNRIVTSLIIALCATLSGSEARAEIQTTTVESRVVAVPSDSPTSSYKIYGPGRVEYVLEAPSQEVTKIAEIARANPNAVVRFEGTVEEGPNRVFRVTKWSKTTSSSTTSGALGNEVTTTRTETTTTR